MDCGKLATFVGDTIVITWTIIYLREPLQEHISIFINVAGINLYPIEDVFK
jgi:hypothetical protein